MKNVTPRFIWQWIRYASARNEDAWRERLAFLGEQNIAIVSRPGTTMIRIEAYSPTPTPLRKIEREFGGKTLRIDSHAIVARANAPRKPLRIGRTMAVLDAHGTWPTNLPKPRILLHIAAAMAFGTGDHATTSACLRFLCTESTKHTVPWTTLDIGTGSAILAIAAEKLGASSVVAFDFDPLAVRAAAANIKRNHCKHITLSENDVLKWRPGKIRHPIVLANIFSDILREASPQITQAVASQGALILSGILRIHEQETLDTFLPLGFTLEVASRRGKWCTLFLRKK